MNDVEYVLEKLSLFNEIPIAGIGEQNRLIIYNGSLFDAEGFYRENQDLWKQLLDRSEEMEEPVLLVESEIFAYALLGNDKQQGKYLIGPVPLGKVSRAEIWSYRNIRKYMVSGYLTDGMRFDQFLSELGLAYYAVYHRQMDTEKLLAENGISKDDWKINEYDYLSYRFSRNERKHNENVYLMEKQWLEWVKSGGDPGKLTPGMSNYAITGDMAQNSLKQQEYTCVCMITLLTRTAVEAHVTPAEAYDISDLYLQKLEKCKDQMSIAAVAQNALNAFLDSIRHAKETSDTPSYIIACKDYIAQHRTDDLKIGDIASVVGLSHSYLAQKFKEYEGITLQQYVIREKVRAAANLIKYSDFSLSEIADYLGFSSQSHMGTYFKKEYGMTPNEYRNKYKVVEFS